MAIQNLESWVIEALIAAGGTPESSDFAARVSRVVGRLARLDVAAIPFADPRYPTGWRELQDPPRALFARGAPVAPPDRSVAIVGSRAATPAGAAFARRLAGDLGGLGLTVVSGLARGIDAAAHRGALEFGALTIAVLPSGLDHVTPVHHRSLADAIANQGTLVSERATGGPRFRGEFVRRNRLIAALAAVTVVVEAAPGSGALTTASFAHSLGREVMAVPGDVSLAGSRGPHALIRAGARLCENASDVMQAMDAWRRRSGHDEASAAASDLLAAVPPTPTPLDAIAARAGLPAAEALAGLLSLQWAGLVEPCPGQRWARVRP